MTGRKSGRPAERRFLFLQGPSSPLFAKIGKNLSARGFDVHRMNICMGDWMFWRGRMTTSYRGTLSAWPVFLAEFLDRHGITDMILLGEERPHHKIATELCRSRGIDVIVVEMGYLRPDWITLERGGMSANSHFPDDPAHILRAASTLPAPDFTPRFSQRFVVDAATDLVFNLSNVFLWFFYPHYRPHAIDHPLAEYAGWVRKLAFGGGARARSREVAERLRRDKTPCFLFPLQLETDYQIRAHSPFSSQAEAIAMVMAAFAAGSDRDCHLVVKVHPLDNGLRDWARICADLAARYGVQSRMTFLHDGNLAGLIEGCRGVVTINSTVGLHALIADRPVKVLGAAIFDVDGLTDKQSLAEFFRNPKAPEPAIRDAFLRLAAAAIHVRGNFYSTAGTDAGAQQIATRLIEGSVNQPDAYVDPPPRLRPKPPKA
jgi:capsular polysaccharide export protein